MVLKGHRPVTYCPSLSLSPFLAAASTSRSLSRLLYSVFPHFFEEELRQILSSPVTCLHPLPPATWFYHCPLPQVRLRVSVLFLTWLQKLQW